MCPGLPAPNPAPPVLGPGPLSAGPGTPALARMPAVGLSGLGLPAPPTKASRSAWHSLRTPNAKCLLRASMAQTVLGPRGPKTTKTRSLASVREAVREWGRRGQCGRRWGLKLGAVAWTSVGRGAAQRARGQPRGPPRERVIPGELELSPNAFLLFSWAEGVPSPPELPPRNIPLSAGPCEPKEVLLLSENPRAAEVSRPSLSETLFQRLQTMDTTG